MIGNQGKTYAAEGEQSLALGPQRKCSTLWKQILLNLISEALQGVKESDHDVGEGLRESLLVFSGVEELVKTSM